MSTKWLHIETWMYVHTVKYDDVDAYIVIVLKL